VFLLARFASEEGATGKKGNSVYGMPRTEAVLADTAHRVYRTEVEHEKK